MEKRNAGAGGDGPGGEAGFDESVRRCLNELFGEAMASSIIRYLGNEMPDSIDALSEKLTAIFGEQTARVILKRMEAYNIEGNDAQ